MKAKKEQNELLLSVAEKLGIKNPKIIVDDEGDFVKFTIPFKGSLEGVIIFVEPNFDTDSFKHPAPLLDDTIRIGINPWSYEDMCLKELKRMKKFLERCLKHVPEAILIWHDDGFIAPKISQKDINEGMDTIIMEAEGF